MSAFHEQLQRDVNAVWFNPDEFGEPHDIDGKTIRAIVDEQAIRPNKTVHDFKQSERTKSVHGVYKDGVTLFVLAEEYGSPPRNGVQLLLDKKYPYRVVTVHTEEGVYAIDMEAIR